MVAFVMLDIVSLVLAIVVAGDNISKIDMFLFFFSQSKFPVLFVRTNKFQSFLNYGLRWYQ